MKTQLLIKTPPAKDPAAASAGRDTGITWLYPPFIAIFCASLAALVVWHVSDHGWPRHDAGEHIKDALEYASLFRHPKFWQPHWIHAMLTVNYCYPASIHAFNGLIKAFLGKGLWVDRLSLVLFAALMNASVYGLGTILLRSRLAGALSVVFLNCYCAVASSSHMPMLDLPMLSVVALSLLSLSWWQSGVSLYRTIVCGLIWAFAISSKQIAAFYMIGPCAILFGVYLFRGKYRELGHLSLIGAFCAGSLLLWLVPNYAAITSWSNHNTALAVSGTHGFGLFLPNLLAYIQLLPGMLTPALLVWSLISAVISRHRLKALWPVAASGCIGLCLMCTQPFVESRYNLAFCLLPALLSGSAAAQLWGSGHRWKQAIVALVLGVGLVQFLCVNYMPYPVWCPPAFTQFMRQVVINTDRIKAAPPTPAGDLWKQEWIINTIEVSHSYGYLNLLPNTPEYNVHTLETIARERNVTLSMTSSRDWTYRGDVFKLPDNQIDYFDWFLLKDGSNGLHMRDAQSQAAFDHTVNYIRHCPRYHLYAQAPVLDGTTIYLYHRN